MDMYFNGTLYEKGGERLTVEIVPLQYAISY